MGFKFLIDENLSPRLVELAHARGHEAVSVRDRGLIGLRDDALVRFAYEGDFILVTRNVRDFRNLLGGVELHAGLIYLQAVGDGFVLETQLDLFDVALAQVEARKDLTNLELDVIEQVDGSFVANFVPLP